MKKIASLIIAACIGGTGLLSAQSMIDAYKLSQTDVNGTARYLSMGGAFGALGGDISSMYSNPAGLGIYRSSEIVGTVSLNIFNTETNWLGSTSNMDRTRFNLDNFAYVGYFPTGNDEGLVGWNVGFSYNRVKNFNRRYTMRGKPVVSIANYISEYTNYLIDYSGKNISGDAISLSNDPYRYSNNFPWMTVLGFQGRLVEELGGFWESDMGSLNNEDEFNPYQIQSANLNMFERGGIHQYNFSFATNISNMVFLGATVGVTDMSYHLSSSYGEDFGNGNYLRWDNLLSVDGNGVNVNVGVIVRPADFLRLGIAYNSPTWYNLTNEYSAYAESNNKARTEWGGKDYYYDQTPVGSHDYKFHTPDKWIFSAAAILGTKALISMDYELINSKNAKFYYTEGEQYDLNEDIRNSYRNVNTFKVGAEYKVTPQFAVRAGAYWQSGAADSQLQESKFEMVADGTMPHYTVDKGLNGYSVGVGYRFTPNFYMDLAYVYRIHKENAYAFSSVYTYDITDSAYDVISTPATLKTNTSRVALTFGYKF